MSDLLAREIVKAARDLENQEKVLVFATLTENPHGFPIMYSLRLPGNAKPTKYQSIGAALRALSKNGFVVDVAQVNAWLQHIENTDHEARSRMIFSKSELLDRSARN